MESVPEDSATAKSVGEVRTVLNPMIASIDASPTVLNMAFMIWKQRNASASTTGQAATVLEVSAFYNEVSKELQHFY